MTRVVHCKKEKYDIYIGRGPCPVTGKYGRWGNPIKVGDIYNGVTMGRGQTIDFYRQWLEASVDGVKLLEYLPELRDKVLGCWCKPQACHGDVLVEMLELYYPQETIYEFQGQYRFLSNFWFCEVDFEGGVYPSVEHAFQAAKTFDPVRREIIRLACSPAGAKALGGDKVKTILRPDWEAEKIFIMEGLLWKKFQDPTLRENLLKTGDAVLIEGNYHGDTTWGVCKGVGENLLGQLLMSIRDQIRDEDNKA